MSRPLKAHGEIDIPENEQPTPNKPRPDIYAVAYTVYGPGGWVFGMDIIPAMHIADAKNLMAIKVYGQYKECAGYINHRLFVKQITDEDLAECGYHR